MLVWRRNSNSPTHQHQHWVCARNYVTVCVCIVARDCDITMMLIRHYKV